MQVKKINDWFEKFGRFEVKHRWAFITGLLIVTINCTQPGCYHFPLPLPAGFNRRPATPGFL